MENKSFPCFAFFKYSLFFVFKKDFFVEVINFITLASDEKFLKMSATLIRFIFVDSQGLERDTNGSRYNRFPKLQLHFS
jgi:hypothetical protein